MTPNYVGVCPTCKKPVEANMPLGMLGGLCCGNRIAGGGQGEGPFSRHPTMTSEKPHHWTPEHGLIGTPIVLPWEAENERLRAELAECRRERDEARANVKAMDEHSTELVISHAAALSEMIESVTKLRAERDELRRGLEPFAEAEWEYDSIRPEDWMRGWAMAEHIKEARRLLAGGPREGGESDGKA